MADPHETTIAAERNRWQYIKQLLAETIARPQADRAAFLDATCAGEPDVRAEIESLLASYHTSSSFLEEPTEVLRAAAAGALVEGHRIGPYRVVREIGHGGMSTVYLAERADEAFQKQVAIKIVPAGLYSAFLVQRFGAERQILAELDHPNIARLLDGGTTADGIPYLVMEFVDGTAIDVYCDRASLPIDARLDLFHQICAAVEYAHQHLVVHRDLKPTNILVTKDGVPKLLDFGIAKILDAEGADPRRDVTVTGMSMLTPRFASPEQVRGQSITTACDVYALGVLLYELLTGCSPYRIASDLPHELARAICEEEPPRPSAAAGRPEVARRLAGDLDTIVLKALAKDPVQRYPSVAHLADDLRRHVAGLPVTARKETAVYRLRKFITRHRIGVAAAAALVVSLAAGLAATLWQTRVAQQERRRAERRFDDARSLINTLLFDVEGAIQNLPGSTPAQNLLISRGLEYLDKLSRDVSSQPALEHDIAVAYRKLGDVQGNPYYKHVGDTDGAVASYRKALTINERLLALQPLPEWRLEVAVVRGRLADMQWARGDFPGAIAEYTAALQIRRDVAAARPQDTALKIDLASSHYFLGQTYLRIEDEAAAAEQYDAARTMWEDVLHGDPQNRAVLRNLAVNGMKIGDLARYRGDLAQAIASHERTITVLEDLSANRANTDLRRVVAYARLRLAEDYLAGRRFVDALRESRLASALAENLAVADPTNAQWHESVAYAQRIVAEALIGLKRYDEARATLGRVRAIITSDAGSRGNQDMLREMSLAWRDEGDLLHALGQRTAVDAYRQAIEVAESPVLRSEEPIENAVNYEHAGDAERTFALRAAAADARALRAAACDHYRRALSALRPLPASNGRASAATARLSSKADHCAAP